MLELIWKGGAEQDLLTIFADLEEYGDGKGEQFTLVLDSVLQNLRAYPEMAPVFERPMRRLVVGSTGFGVFYTVETRGIIVHAILHLRQNPESIRDRIRRLLRLR